MQLAEIMQQLEAWGSEQTKKTLMRHGAREPLFGVKVGDLKKIEKKVKKNHQLAMQLYDTGNADAMYLAGLIADVRGGKVPADRPLVFVHTGGTPSLFAFRDDLVAAITSPQR